MRAAALRPLLKPVHWWNAQRLHIQLALLSGLVIGVTLLVHGYYVAQQQADYAYQNNLDNAHALANNIAVTSTYQIVNADYYALEELLVKSVGFPGVTSVQIRDPQGRSLGQVHKTADGRARVIYTLESIAVPPADSTTAAEMIEQNHETFSVWAPAIANSLLAWVRLDYDLVELARLRHEVLANNLIATLWTVVIDIGVLFLILIPPVRALKRASVFAAELCEFKGGRLQERMSSREINELAASLNQASTTLYQQHHTITAHADALGLTAQKLALAKEELEQRVEERTRQLSWRATHDTLTGLYNRFEFEKRLAQLVHSSERDRRQHVLFYIDLDQFKIINDTCGHLAGDELLKQVSLRMRTIIRGSDVLARLGGDEFGILLLDCNLERAKTLANTMLNELRGYRFGWKDKVFTVGISLGIVEIDDTAHDPQAILSAADMACYSAKDNGRNQFRIYHADDEGLTVWHGEMSWATRIPAALSEGRMRLYAQPIVGLQGDPGEVTHFEILVRMLDESGEIVAPNAFLPAAERYGLISDIDRWVVENTLSFYRRHQLETAARPVVLSINLSGASLGDQAFQAFALDCVKKYAIPRGRLCFEITETAAITHLINAIDFISELKGAGCDFALDDFGTGLSSFSYLKSLPVDYLKIDGSFIREMKDDAMDYIIVESINNLAHTLRLETIAEFVEDTTTADLLRDMGIDYGQGYCFSKPHPIEDYFPAAAARLPDTVTETLAGMPAEVGDE